jgi:acyl carrier protein
MSVYPKAAKIIATALPCGVVRVKPETSLIEDLGAQSIGFLDIVFRLEWALKVKIPRGKPIEETLTPVQPGQFL